MSSFARRPSLKHNRRPSSAIFLGTTPQTSQFVPELPQPPSPDGSSKASSGLPSPPATNSTDSGSTGDMNSSYTGSIRQRPISLNDPPTEYKQNGSVSRRSSISSSGGRGNNFNPNDHEYEHNDNDEDNTARLYLRRSDTSSTENLLALERVKSLTERNRMVIDKLTRLSSPPPSSTRSGTRSPHISSSASSTSASSSNSGKSASKTNSRLSLTSAESSSPHTRSQSLATSSASAYQGERNQNTNDRRSSQYQTLSRTNSLNLSGSETETESHHALSSINSPPPSNLQSLSSNPYGFSSDDLPSTSSNGMRRSSTPSWSGRTRLRSAPTSPAKALQQSTARKQVSMVLGNLEESSIDRTGTVSGKKSRQPLPREFTNTGNGRFSTEPPQTPHRDRYFNDGGSPSPTRRYTPQDVRSSPRGPKSSGARETAKNHQSRLYSEDMRSGSIDEGRGDNEIIGRRQGLRGGSAESGLTATAGIGGRLIGEGLRAAGILRRGEFDDGAGRERRLRERVASTLDAERDRSHSRLGSVGTERGGYGRRAATSMADYRQQPDEEFSEPLRTAPADTGGGSGALRTYKSAYGLLNSDRVAERAASSMGRYATAQERHPSPFGGRRYVGNSANPSPQTGAKDAAANANTEHTRLMADSLSMFESHLSRLPSSGVDLYRTAQGLVATADRLNNLLRTGTNRALEAQIDAELGDDDEVDSEKSAEVWRIVGAEYREGLRASDELVRGMTGFLLGVGKVIKDTLGEGGGTYHSRSMSLNDEGVGGTGSPRRKERLSLSPELTGASGRRSAESRRSWEPMVATGSDFQGTRRSSAKFESMANEDVTSLTAQNLSSLSSRPAGGRASLPALPTSSSEYDDLRRYADQDHEPSPTPATRIRDKSATSPPTGQTERSRTLPPLSIPAPLPSLPSEEQPSSTLRRSNTQMFGPDKSSTLSHRTKAANTAGTVRGSPLFTALSSSSATTAVTTQAFPLMRTASNQSASSTGSKVTFSRPSTISVSTLNGVSQRDRKRTISSSRNGEAPGTMGLPPVTPVSGSENERGGRKSTLKTPRSSLEGERLSETTNAGNSGRRADRERESTILPARKERRKTLTEIFS